MKTLKKLLFTFGFAVLLAAPVMTIAAPQPAYAATDCEVSILGIPPWYRGIVERDAISGDCVIATPGSVMPDGKTLDLSGFIWRIALNVIEIALFLVGYIAVFFVMYGGFQFLTGGDSPDKVQKARKTILNALVGLVISIGAVVVTNLIFGILG